MVITSLATYTLGAGVEDLMSSAMENARYAGNNSNNWILSGDGSDIVHGLGGNDTIYGSLGNDTIYGGAGNDTLYGESDKDFFVFDTKPNAKTNVDAIRGFSPKDDTIWLENKVFTKVGKNGVLKKSAFWSGTKTHDKDDRVIYDKHRGNLYYDADGTGKSKQVLVAKLKITDFAGGFGRPGEDSVVVNPTKKKIPALTYMDFFII